MSTMFPGSVVVTGAAILCVLVPQRSGAQSIASVVLSTPTSVCAQDMTVRVNLAAPAPTGGVAVQVSSSLPTVLALPSVLTIPSGATSAPIAVRCTPTPQAVAVTISATAGGATQTAILNVLAPVLDRIALKANENSARVVTSFTGAAILAGPAPAGGVIVTLSHDQPAFATIPASVMIPAGAASANFTVSNVKSVPQSTTITVTATGLGATRTTTAVLLPPTLVSLLFERSNNMGGAPTYVALDTIPSSSTILAQLRLAAPASTSGLVVNLTSSNPAVVSVPSTVTVPAGDSVVRVPVSSASSGQTASATVSASVGAVSKSATVVVSSITLMSVAANPSRVVGGQAVQGSVSSDRPAPPGGMLVKLASGNINALLVPPTVTIPAGERTAPFTASTFAVTAPTQVTVTGTIGNVSKSAIVSLATEGISQFSTSVASVRGSTGLTGRLEAHPGHDGFTVLLSSATPSTVELPANVVFAAGETVKTFPITTSPVKTSTTVALTARVVSAISTRALSAQQQLTRMTTAAVSSIGTTSAVPTSITRTASVTVTPPNVATVSVSPAEVIGGSARVITGTITLDAPAPAGFSVFVSSGSTTVGVTPSLISIPEGTTSATFSARTLPVTSSQSVSITVSVPNVQQSSAGTTVRVRPRG